MEHGKIDNPLANSRKKNVNSQNSQNKKYGQVNNTNEKKSKD